MVKPLVAMYCRFSLYWLFRGMDPILETIDEALKRKGLSDAAASKLAVGHPSLIKNLRMPRSGEKRYNLPALKKLAEILDLELYFGPVRKSEVAKTPRSSAWDTFSDRTLPRKGIAACGVNGWGKDQPFSDPLPAPDALDDPDAFYVSAAGQSMIPEGIHSGMFCLVSPSRKAVPGDRVWLRDKNNATAIKRLVKVEGDSLHLRGWQPHRDGKQESFDEERLLGFIAEYHPVVAVYNGKPGTVSAHLEADPKAPDHISHIGGDMVQIKLHDQQFAAGSGRLESEGIMSSVAFPSTWLHRMGLSERSATLVWVEGDSMAPTLKSGSMVMLDTRIQDIKKRCIYAFRFGEELYVKRLERVDDMLIAQSDNPAYNSMVITGADRDQFQMFGEVVWSGHEIAD